MYYYNFFYFLYKIIQKILKKGFGRLIVIYLVFYRMYFCIHEERILIDFEMYYNL